LSGILIIAIGIGIAIAIGIGIAIESSFISNPIAIPIAIAI